MKEQNTKVLSISQSLLKKYWDYMEDKECGHAMHQIDMLKNYESEPSDPMKVGSWFEYLCTGTKNRDGSVPEPVKNKSGLSADSKRAELHVANFKRLIESENITIIEGGKVLEYHYPGQNFKIKGILDALIEYDGEVAILDLKTSGLIGKEWEEYGWHTSTFNMRRKLTIQVVFYKYLGWKVLDIKDIPFYFSVHSTKNEIDSLFWRVDLHDFNVSMSHFEEMLLDIVPDIEMGTEFGFTAYPDVRRCGKCPVFKDCEYKRDTPEKEIVVIDGLY
jgi:hypothetical protein